MLSEHSVVQNFVAVVALAYMGVISLNGDDVKS